MLAQNRGDVCLDVCVASGTPTSGSCGMTQNAFEVCGRTLCILRSGETSIESTVYGGTPRAVGSTWELLRTIRHPATRRLWVGVAGEA